MSNHAPSASGSGTVAIVAWGLKTPQLVKQVAARMPLDTLVVCDPLLADDVETSLPKGIQTVDCLRADLGETGTKATLIVHSLPGLYSRHPANDRLKAIFPGLQTRRHRIVPRVATADLAAKLADAPRPLHLVIETPGVERQLLEDLEACDALSWIDTLSIRLGREAFFAGAESEVGIRAWLADRQFRVVREARTDPDWPELHIEVDPAALRAQIKQVNDRLAYARAELLHAQETLTSERARLEALEEAHADRGGELEELRATLEKTSTRADSETEARISSDALGRQLSGQVDSLQAELAEARDRLDELEIALEEARGAATTQAEKTAAREAELAEQAETLARLHEEIERLGRSEDMMRSDLAVALRTQDLAQADLQDLQMRFREVDSTRREQAILLEKLTPRLQQAASQLHALAHEAPEVAKQLGLSTATTAEEPRSTGKTQGKHSRKKPGSRRDD